MADRTISGGGPISLASTELVATDSGGSLTNIASGTTGQVLISNGSTTLPSFQSGGAAASISGGNTGQVVYQSAPNTTTFSNAASGILQSNGTLVSFTNLISTSKTIDVSTGTALQTRIPAAQIYNQWLEQKDVASATANYIYMSAQNGKSTTLGPDGAQDFVLFNNGTQLITIANTAGAIRLKADGAFLISHNLSAQALATSSDGTIISVAGIRSTTLFFDSFQVLAGNPLFISSGSLAVLYYSKLKVHQNPSNLGDIASSVPFTMAPGTYAVWVHATTAGGSGICDLYLNNFLGAPLNTSPIDLFAVSTVLLAANVGSVTIDHGVNQILIKTIGTTGGGYDNSFYKIVLK